MRNNYIRIPRRGGSDHVYRFTTVERLLNTLVQRTNTLVSPRKWDDPFENALAAQIRLKRPDGSTAPYPLRNRAYGQCWTITEETDAAWSMYVPRGKGVRLRSTVRKLCSSLEKQCPEPYASMACFIGRVEYRSREDIEALFNDKEWANNNFIGQGTHAHVATLLIKRLEFKSEAEVRLLYLDPHNKDHGDVFTYQTDPSSLIEEITFDPRMEDTECTTFEFILRNCGYTGVINKSALYRAPDIKICV